MKDVFAMLYKSFWSVEAYRAAVFGWKWKAVLYFFIVCCITASGAWVMASKYLGDFVTTDLNPAIAKISGAKVADGKVRTPDGKPIALASKSGRVFAVISPEYIDANEFSALFFAFEKDRFTLRLPDGSENFEPLSSIETLVDSGGGKDASGGVEISLLLEYLIWWMRLILPVVLLMISIFKNLSFVAILSLAALMLSLSLMPKMTYPQCVKLALLTLTPPLFLEAVLMAVFTEPVPGFAYAIISGAMLVYVMYGFRRAALSDGKILR